jgi:hypothetical protein
MLQGAIQEISGVRPAGPDDLAELAAAYADGDVPSRWTPQWVEARLIESYDVLRRTPARIGPSLFGSCWPAILREADEIGRELEELARMNRAAYEELLAKRQDLREAIAIRREEQQEAADRRERMPSAAEASRAEEALGWALLYLRDQPELADGLQTWARCVAYDISMAAVLSNRRAEHDDRQRGRLGTIELDRQPQNKSEIDRTLHRRSKYMADKVARRQAAEDAARARRRAEIAARVAAWANERLEKATDPEHVARIKANAKIRLKRHLEQVAGEVKQIKVRREDVEPGRCYSKRRLQECRKIAASFIADALNRDGIEVR